MLRLLLQGFLAVALTSVGLAELAWEQPRVAIEPPLGAHEATGVFTFTNTGTEAVRILEVQSGCGCTTPAPEKDVIAPGESGKIHALYHVGERRGKQSVAITVKTDESSQAPYNLTLEVNIRDFATLTPRAVSWRVGDAGEPKLLKVALAPGFEFIGAESSSGSFTVEVASKSSESVQLRISPSDTWAKRNADIKITVAKGGKDVAQTQARARVL